VHCVQNVQAEVKKETDLLIIGHLFSSSVSKTRCEYTYSSKNWRQGSVVHHSVFLLFKQHDLFHSQAEDKENFPAVWPSTPKKIKINSIVTIPCPRSLHIYALSIIFSCRKQLTVKPVLSVLFAMISRFGCKMRTNNYDYTLDLSLQTLLQAKLLAELNRTFAGLWFAGADLQSANFWRQL